MKRAKSFMAVVTAALVMAMGFIAATTTTASADFAVIKMGPSLTVDHRNGNPSVNLSTSAGAFVLPENYPAWCIDPLKSSPTATNVRYKDLHQVKSWKNGQNAELTRAQLAQLAYLAAKYGGVDAYALSNEKAAAIDFAAKHLAGYDNVAIRLGRTEKGSYLLTDRNSHGSRLAIAVGVYDQALAMVVDTEANYSLWDGTHTQEVLSEAILETGDMFQVRWTLPGIRAGKEIVVTLTHPDGSTAKHTIVTDARDQALFEYTIPAGVTGEYSVTAEMSVTTTTLGTAVYPVLAIPSNNSAVQSLLVGTGPVTTPWRASAQARVLTNVSIDTTVSASVSQPGDTISDDVTITGLAPAGFDYTLTGTISHLPEGETDWSQASVVHTFTPAIVNTDIVAGVWSETGLGSWTIPAGATGQYSYGYELTATPTSPGPLPSTIIHAAGIPQQTTTIVVTTVVVTTGGSLDSGNAWLLIALLGATGIALTGGIVARAHRQRP